jgi:hypothetical protein
VWVLGVVLLIAGVWYLLAPSVSTYVSRLTVLPGGKRIVVDCIRRAPDRTETQNLFLIELGPDGTTVQKTTSIPIQRAVVSNVYELSPRYWLLVDQVTHDRQAGIREWRLCVLRADTWEYISTRDIHFGGGSPVTILGEDERTLIVHSLSGVYRVSVAPETGELLSAEHIPEPVVAPGRIPPRLELFGRNAAGELVFGGSDHHGTRGADNRPVPRKSVYLWRVGKEPDAVKVADLPRGLNGRFQPLGMSRDGSVFLAALDKDDLLMVGADGRGLAQQYLKDECWLILPGLRPTSFLVFSDARVVQEVSPGGFQDVATLPPFGQAGVGASEVDTASSTLFLGISFRSGQAEVRRFRRGDTGWEKLPSIPIPR